MEQKGRIVIITNANMHRQSGDVTLIIRRARAIYDLSGKETVCLLLKDKEISTDEKGITYKAISHKYEMAGFLKEIKPEKVIFFGIRSFKYISFVKRVFIKEKMNTELICDIQGVPEEFIEFKQGLNKILSYPLFLYKKYLLKQGIVASDGSFIVSSEMRKYLNELKGPKKQNDYKFYKIRCGIEEFISSEQKLAWRNEIRSEIGVNENTHIFVFSGYRMPWQKLDEILNIFQYYDMNADNVFFAIFCNIDKEFSEKIERMFPKKNYLLKFLKRDEYYKYLVACDLGFLIRDIKTTNRVAFPNKFSDYLNAGLTVAMNESVSEPFEILKKYNVDYINTKDIRNIETLEEVMLRRKKSLDEYYRVTERICNSELSYENQLKSEGFI